MDVRLYWAETRARPRAAGIKVGQRFAFTSLRGSPSLPSSCFLPVALLPMTRDTPADGLSSLRPHLFR